MKNQILSADKYKVIRYSRVDSTNRIAYELGCKDAVHGTVVLADEQSVGRGRKSRLFISPRGGLYLSVILRPQLPVEEISLVTLAAGVATAEAVELITGISAQLKWPNDLYCNGKKLGGILTEAAPYSQLEKGVPFVVVGIGLNVNTRSDLFPHALHDIATSLYSITDQKYDINTLMDSLMDSLLVEVTLLQKNKEKVMSHWRHRDYLLGKNLSWKDPLGQVVHGTGSGLLPDGRYRLTSSGGDDYPVIAGDISIIELSGGCIK